MVVYVFCYTFVSTKTNNKTIIKMKKPNNISKNFKAMSRKAKEMGFKNVMEALDAGMDSKLEGAYNNSKQKRNNRKDIYAW